MVAAIRCRNYQELVGALAARRRQLGLRQLDCDERAGLQGGYTGKIEAKVRKLGDLSLPMLCAALDVDILVAPRSESAPIEREQLSADKADRTDSRALPPTGDC
jgi:hypothetical protein